MLHGTEPLHHGLWVVAGAIVSLLLAALFTVLLVFSSRRATLRQINVSLMEISEQLKQLRRSAPT
jgi:type II secretory pathway pseudopilin PulG